MLSQQVIKKSNLKKVFSLILQHSPISRIELSKMTLLSKTTISALVDELIMDGYVVDDGEVNTGKQGRKPSVLRVNSGDNVVAVVNWHNEEMEASLVDLRSDTVFRVVFPAPAGSNFPGLIRGIYESTLLREAGERRVLGFCLIVPSMLDSQRKRMISTTLPVAMNSDVMADLFPLFTDIPVAVFNDTACYAYAECALTKIPRTFTFININKGVGAIIVKDGVMLRGEDGMRPQLGHYSICRDGDLCVCGNRGCLENEIGEAALERRAKRLACLETLGEALLEVDKVHAGRGCVTFKGLGILADGGNSTAREFVKGLAEDLAYVLCNLATIYNTNNIIIGGRGQKLGSYYLNELSDSVHDVGFKEFTERMRPQYSSLGDDAIMRGAARYYIDKYYDFFEPMESFIVLE